MKTMKILVKTSKGFVSGVNHEHVCVVLTQDETRAKKFKSEGEVNHWLDQYVNAGMGLSWNDDIKLLKF